MAYSVSWLAETEQELRRFSRRFQSTIINKVTNIADNVPTSLRLRSVQIIRGQETLRLNGVLYELDVGSGPRVAFLLDVERERLIVYLVGTHDYCKENYLAAAADRLEG